MHSFIHSLIHRFLCEQTLSALWRCDRSQVLARPGAAAVHATALWRRRHCSVPAQPPCLRVGRLRRTEFRAQVTKTAEVSSSQKRKENVTETETILHIVLEFNSVALVSTEDKRAQISVLATTHCNA